MKPAEYLNLIPEQYRQYARQYAIEKCEEQKKICVIQADVDEPTNLIEKITKAAILNAPLPDID